MFTSEENEENDDGSGVAGVVIDKHAVVDDDDEDRDYDELWRAMITTTLTMMMTKTRKREITNEMLYFFLKTVKKGKQNRLITVVGYSCFTVFKYYE